MIIRNLEISGLGIIGEKISLDFPTKGKIGIFGNNETGKSTLLESIPIALYGIRGTTKNKEEIITWTKKKCTIGLEFEVNNQLFRIEREFSQNGHNAVLYSMIDGKKEILEKNLKEIENQILQITGLDYNSFTKLVYIKQKELDSLRDLAKNDREQLINKIIGIEEFGNAEKAIKEDKKQLEINLDKFKREYEILTEKQSRHNKLLEDDKQYEQNIKKLAQDVDAAKKKKNKLKEEFDQLDWSKNKQAQEQMFKDAKEKLQIFEENEQQIHKTNLEIGQLTETIGKNTIFQEQNETEYKALTKLEESLNQLNNTLDTEQNDKIKLEQEIHATTTEEQKLNYSTDLSARKQKTLLLVGLLAIIPIVGIVLGLTINPLFFLGAILLIPAYWQWKKYGEYEKITTIQQQWMTKTAQLKEKEEKITDIKTKIQSKLTKENINDPVQINKRINQINERLNHEFDVNSFDSLAQLIKSKKSEKEKKLVEITAIQKKLKKTPKEHLMQTIQNHETTMKDLESKKPKGTDESKLSEQNLKQTKKELDGVEENYNQIAKDLHANEKLLEKTIQDLESDDYKKLPEKIQQTNKNLTETQQEIEVLELLRTTLKETSHELRAQVIPRAQMTIENLLPTLTDNRYFRLNIKEDFTFEAYATETNQSKPRDLFSGGTQDQFLIALRIAFAQSILTAKQNNETTTSLFMDECISSSDQARQKGIFTILNALKKDFSQIFIIAHEDITENVDYALRLERTTCGYTTIKQKSW
ncbi:MAG TPA: AAA family ATPase [archaeon]|nr:AAA family ATPase [archaeon]